MTRVLSTSRLIAFRQCPKRMWLEIHRPDLREDSAGTLASFLVGIRLVTSRRVYDLDGTGMLIDIATEGFAAGLDRYERLLSEGRQIVFEAGFEAAGALSLADVIIPLAANGEIAWRMVEVKSSTGVRDYLEVGDLQSYV